MILYLDTSALVKRYFKEVYSKDVVSKWLDAAEVATSSVAYAETMAAIYRKKREIGYPGDLFQQLINEFRADWISFIRIRVDDELNEYIDKTVASHPLRGFDAVHLASAMILHERFHDDLLFACFDGQLLEAARKEGLRVFPG